MAATVADPPPDASKPARPKRARKAALPLFTAPEPSADNFVPIATDRLILRPFRPDDAQALHRLINDWEVTRNLAVVPFPYQREAADEWIAATRQKIAERREYHLAITGRENDQEMLIGAIGLRINAKTHRASLGYWVGKRFWGHGVATEAAHRFARWAMANLDIDGLEANVFTDNPGSMAVLARIGFRQTGEGVEFSAARKAEARVLRYEATRTDLFGETTVAAEVEAAPSGKLKILLVAACALIDVDNRVLLARRPEGKKMAGLWEFPGGKLDPGETPEAALIRELKEELGIDVTASCLAPFAFASYAYDKFHLLMPLFLCRRWRGTPVAREGQTLAWVRPDKLGDYKMPPADKPLVPLLRDFL